ncbi:MULTISPECIES: hypothetical protein [Selenomonas]|uniref:hypothetical protein n=1 Tax=Selenomonas TaxID=970 RepID=UPI0001EB29D4|nr:MULTISPECIES: hypothetical protein [Selenomonas]EFR40944.1 hypothetical protein HMPREF9162_2148 [Selenomonas sp. oral taxon 137 str. F0430]MBF1682620.1 hypothetical protein [Selenomonas artemidis]
MQKIWGAALVAGAVFLMGVRPAAAEEIPKNIYQWVQSTARQGYYFNKEQIQYAADAHGYIDLTKLVVPTLRIYDNIQIQDVVSKRRWRMLPLSGYGDLTGAAEYLLIDLRAGVVHVTAHEDLDSNWGTLSREENTKEFKLSSLSDKDVEKKFFDAIIAYAAEHQEELIHRSRGILSDADRAALASKKEKSVASDEKTREKHVKKEKKAKKNKKK